MQQTLSENWQNLDEGPLRTRTKGHILEVTLDRPKACHRSGNQSVDGSAVHEFSRRPGITGCDTQSGGREIFLSGLGS